MIFTAAATRETVPRYRRKESGNGRVQVIQISTLNLVHIEFNDRENSSKL